MSTYPTPAHEPHGIMVAPTTPLGLQAVQSAVASVIGLASLTFAAVLGPSDPGGLWGLAAWLGALVGLVFAITAAVMALGAIFRRGERAVSVYLAFLPFLTVVLWPLHSLFMSD
jgi:ABC-type polysaccharide/polyol phosphate export permease